MVSAGAVFVSALSALLTWAASPYDEALGSRFEPVFFPARNLVPFGYTVFAILLGIVAGLVIRRTVPAIAIALAAVLAMQILVPTVVRPNLQPAVTELVAFTETPGGGGSQLTIPCDGAVIVNGYGIPGAWVLSGWTPLQDAAGDPVTQTDLADCMAFEFGQHRACFATLDLHYVASHQPADRYWTFQWLELLGYLLLAGLLALYAFWRIPRGVS